MSKPVLIPVVNIPMPWFMVWLAAAGLLLIIFFPDPKDYKTALLPLGLALGLLMGLGVVYNLQRSNRIWSWVEWQRVPNLIKAAPDRSPKPILYEPKENAVKTQRPAQPIPAFFAEE